jgi:hypothetical protein
MKRLFLANVAVLVFLAPQQILNLASDSAVQRTVEAVQRTFEAATPWFQVVAASFTILKHGKEFLAKKDKTSNSNDNDG